MQTSKSLIGDLEAAVQNGTQEHRIDMMRQVTALFLGGADRFTREQIDLFDDVLTRLTRQVESRVLTELAVRLAPLNNAPNGTIQSLARHDEIAVAGPVLAQSSRLSDQDLIEIAQTKGQEHLGAISERTRIAAAVTDILVDRGNNQVIYKLSRNGGASFSDAGFNTLAKRAETDGELAETLRARPDMSPQLFRQLVLKATDAVRARLLASAPPDVQATIRNVLETVSTQVMQAGSRDFKRAEAIIAKASRDKLLNEATVINFAESGQYEEFVVGLAQICGAPFELIEQLMQSPDYQGILVACKAAGFSWRSFCTIVSYRTHRQPSDLELQQASKDFLTLSVATAQRMFRFWIVRGLATHQFEVSAGKVH